VLRREIFARDPQHELVEAVGVRLGGGPNVVRAGREPVVLQGEDIGAGDVLDVDIV
jgi:hypothetical protein